PTHKNIHSFPTRRSSDLKDVKPAQDQKNPAGQMDHAAWMKKFKEDLKLTDEQSQKFDALNKDYSEKIDAIGKDATLSADDQKIKDRKSTRLNSSHDQISY